MMRNPVDSLYALMVAGVIVWVTQGIVRWLIRKVRSLLAKCTRENS